MKSNILFLMACCAMNFNNINSAAAVTDPSQYQKNCESLNGMKVLNSDNNIIMASNNSYLPLERCSMENDGWFNSTVCLCYSSRFPNSPITVDEDTAAELANQRQNNKGLQKSEKETNDQLQRNLHESQDLFSGKAHSKKRYKM